jgi:hypothetical protein
MNVFKEMTIKEIGKEFYIKNNIKSYIRNNIIFISDFLKRKKEGMFYGKQF